MKATESKGYVVYVLQSPKGQIYVGMSLDIEKRLKYHRREWSGWTKRMQGLAELIHVEWYSNREFASKRERQIKRWSRVKKLALARKELGALKSLSRSRSSLKKHLDH